MPVGSLQSTARKMLPAVTSLCLCACASTPDAYSRCGVDGPVQLEIALASSRLFVGEYAEVTASVRNISSEAIVLLQPGDGSELGLRTPEVTWFDGKRIAGQAPFEICLTLNPLDRSDIIELAPGESAPLSPWINRPLMKRSGMRSIRLRYENRPTTHFFRKFPFEESRQDPEALMKVPTSLKVDVTSCPLDVMVLQR